MLKLFVVIEFIASNVSDDISSKSFLFIKTPKGIFLFLNSLINSISKSFMPL